MAQSYTTNDGITLVNPGTYVSTQVKSGQGSIASAGVVTIIGEADEGPAYTDEPDLTLVAFTPDSFDLVLAKYTSGRIVEAFKGLVAAANDPAIIGGVSLVRVVKTNTSAAASAAMADVGFGTYATMTARKMGASGNLIRVQSAIATAEQAPVIDSIAYVPHQEVAPLSFSLRMNGGTKKTVSVTPKMAGPAFVAATEDVADGILVTGGTQVLPLASLVAIHITATASGTTLQLALAAGSVFSGSPAVGDVVVIPLTGDYGAAADSVVKGATGQNVGSYMITAISNTISSAVMMLQKLTATAPANVSSVAIAATTDIVLYKPITIVNATSQNRQALVGLHGTFNCTTNDGTNVVLVAPMAWAAMPQVGDYMKVSTAFAGITAGHYVVTTASTTSVSATRLSAGSAGATGSDATHTTPIVAGAEPVTIERPVVDGVSKSLEVIGDTTKFIYTPAAVPATISNSIESSGAEQSVTTTVSRGSVSASHTAGGEVVLAIGCSTDAATVVVAATSITFKVAGVTQFTTAFTSFPTLSDIAAFVSTKTGWSAAVTSARYNSASPSQLDKGTYGVSAASGFKAGQIKRDAYDWATEVSGDGLAVPTMTAVAGLPEVISTVFLSGGSKGGTTGANVISAIDACEDLTTNFIVPLFSADSTVDVLSGDTESTSTYTIDAINAYAKTHVIKMSELKMRRNRMALVSIADIYENCKEMAAEMSSFRVGVAFQPVKNVNTNGVIATFQPWMGAINAAGMQAAAGYKGIVKKFSNISGYIDPTGFRSNKPGDTEDALKSGLLILEKVPTGGFRWLSDQLSYSVDNNFVYNSLQAVYIADLMALTLIDRFDRAVVGRSVAEVSAQAALSILSAEMFNFLRLRWIAPSDDAILGYKNASVRLNGGVMQISVEVKLAGIIYFVPISFTISEVTQTA